MINDNSVQENEIEKLKEENDLLLSIVNAIPEPIVAKNWNGNFIFANEAVAKLYNVTPKEMIGHDDGYFTGNLEQAEFFKQNVQEVMRRFQPEMVYEDSTDAKTGEIRHYHSLKMPFKDSKGDLNISVFAKDITEVTRLKNKAQENEKRLDYVLDATGEGIWDYDIPSGWVINNRQWCKLSGIDDQQNRVEDILKSVHPEDQEAFISNVDAAIQFNKPLNHKFRMVHKNGDVVWVHDKGKVVEFDKNGSPSRMVGAIHDITNEVLQHERIEQLAFFDVLTGLPNRRLLNDRLQQSIKLHNNKGTYGALLFMDLDHFKVLNDIHGHQMGDQLLVEIAVRLQGNLKQNDSAARFGGDEFVIILNDLADDPAKAGIMATRIAQSFRDLIIQPVTLFDATTEKQIEYDVTSSIGIVVYPSPDDTPDKVIQLADMALYKAKAKGRDSFVTYKQDMQEELDSSILLFRDLKRAVNEELLELYYQPKYDVDLNLIGAEALLRWNSESRGAVPPSVFIEVAEESNLILPLGDWVLKTACKQLALWQSEGINQNISLAVNLSAKQIWQYDFVDYIKSFVNQYSFNPSLLTLEITESVLLRDLKDTVKKLKRVKELGVKISLDDFGTGYSSLSYLKLLPVDEIKIDASFVRDIVDDSSDYMMVKAITDLGQNFNVNVVAEGVETQDHLKCLESIGVTFYQGFLFSKALPLNEFEKLL